VAQATGANSGTGIDARTEIDKDSWGDVFRRQLLPTSFPFEGPLQLAAGALSLFPGCRHSCTNPSRCSALSFLHKPSSSKPRLTGADCRAAGLPEIACTGVSSNDEWTPVIRGFDGVPMALVPAGCFTMGSTDEQINYALDVFLDRRSYYEDEQPAHQQCFAEPFWIDVYEVTNEQYGSYDVRPGDDLPRDYISWFDSAAHCESRGMGLPSEVEWEYAARGPDSLIFPWGNEFDNTQLNYCDISCSSPGADTGAGDGYSVTGPVGSFPGGASWVGALDMSGNVWEWVSSMMHEYPYRQDDGREVDGKSDSSSLRALRGAHSRVKGPPCGLPIATSASRLTGVTGLGFAVSADMARYPLRKPARPRFSAM